MYFLWKLGEKAFIFMLVYSLISTVLVAMFLSVNIRPPDIILSCPLDINKINETAKELSSTPNGNPIASVGFGWKVVTTLKNFGYALGIGIIKFLYELAVMTNIPALVVGATFLGAIIQLSGWVYFARLVLKVVHGGW